METEERDIVVECRNLRKSYILGEVRVDALRGINMKIYRGEMVSIMGPSGCGKTTLLNIIGSLDNPSSGQVLLERSDISRASEQQLTEIRRKSVGFIFQFYNLLPVLTALENVELPMLIAGIPKDERVQRATELLEKVDLLRRKDHKPDELSGGERQRVAIARALSNRPTILLADEPTGDLDTESGTAILNLLKELQKRFDLSYLFITHDLSVIQHIADRVQVMYLGKMVEGGTIDEVFYNPTHPYTKALLSARPTFDPGTKTDRIILEGDVPSPINPPSGCAFHPRCFEKGEHDGCHLNSPKRVELGGEHYMYCSPLSDKPTSYEGMEYISD